MRTPSERRGAVFALLLLGLAAGLFRPPGAPAPPPAAAPPAPAVPDDPRLDLNRAGAALLDTLPGIGPVLARRIVEHRETHGPFESVEDLRAVRGIGARLLERVRGSVRVGSPGRDRSRGAPDTLGGPAAEAPR